MVALNINSYVRIKLTDYGLEILRSNHERISEETKSDSEFVPPEVDEKGYSKMMLWQVMNIFGKELFMGATNMPFAEDILIEEA